MQKNKISSLSVAASVATKQLENKAFAAKSKKAIVAATFVAAAALGTANDDEEDDDTLDSDIDDSDTDVDVEDDESLPALDSEDEAELEAQRIRFNDMLAASIKRVQSSDAGSVDDDSTSVSSRSSATVICASETTKTKKTVVTTKKAAKDKRAAPHAPKEDNGALVVRKSTVAPSKTQPPPKRRGRPPGKKRQRTNSNSSIGSSVSSASAAAETGSRVVSSEACGNIYAQQNERRYLYICTLCNAHYGALDVLAKHLQERHQLIVDESPPRKSVRKNAKTPVVDIKVEQIVSQPSGLLYCGKVVVLSRRIVNILCGYCECKFEKFELLDKHLRAEHKIFELNEEALQLFEPKQEPREQVFSSEAPAQLPGILSDRQMVSIDKAAAEMCTKQNLVSLLQTPDTPPPEENDANNKSDTTDCDDEIEKEAKVQAPPRLIMKLKLPLLKRGRDKKKKKQRGRSKKQKLCNEDSDPQNSSDNLTRKRGRKPNHLPVVDESAEIPIAKEVLTGITTKPSAIERTEHIEIFENIEQSSSNPVIEELADSQKIKATTSVEMIQKPNVEKAVNAKTECSEVITSSERNKETKVIEKDKTTSTQKIIVEGSKAENVKKADVENIQISASCKKLEEFVDVKKLEKVANLEKMPKATSPAQVQRVTIIEKNLKSISSTKIQTNASASKVIESTSVPKIALPTDKDKTKMVPSIGNIEKATNVGDNQITDIAKHEQAVSTSDVIPQKIGNTFLLQEEPIQDKVNSAANNSKIEMEIVKGDGKTAIVKEQSTELANITVAVNPIVQKVDILSNEVAVERSEFGSNVSSRKECDNHSVSLADKLKPEDVAKSCVKIDKISTISASKTFPVVGDTSSTGKLKAATQEVVSQDIAPITVLCETMKEANNHMTAKKNCVNVIAHNTTVTSADEIKQEPPADQDEKQQKDNGLQASATDNKLQPIQQESSVNSEYVIDISKDPQADEIKQEEQETEEKQAESAVVATSVPEESTPLRRVRKQRNYADYLVDIKGEDNQSETVTTSPELSSSHSTDTTPPKRQRSTPTVVNTKDSDPAYRFSCDFCGKSFNKSSRLQDHRRLHTGEKPFECSECKRTFRLKMRLTEHMLRHRTEKAFKCETCGLPVSTKQDLSLHMRHHKDDRRYKCDVCEKAFVRSSDLSIHVRIHTGEKPFSCEFCNKAFRARQNLHVHRRSHLGEKPIKCEICEKRFSRKIDLRVHMRKHTGEKPYMCEICKRGYSSRVNMHRHMEREHVKGERKKKPGRKSTNLKEKLAEQEKIIEELTRRLKTGQSLSVIAESVDGIDDDNMEDENEHDDDRDECKSPRLLELKNKNVAAKETVTLAADAGAGCEGVVQQVSVTVSMQVEPVPENAADVVVADVASTAQPEKENDNTLATNTHCSPPTKSRAARKITSYFTVVGQQAEI